MQRRPLTDRERRDWLLLSRTENVGSITFRHLLSRFGSAKAALEAIPDMAKRGGKTLKLPSITAIDDEMARTQKVGGKIIAWCEPDYPESLAAIEDAPPLISVLGQISLLHKRIIGIVGARNASLNGRKMAEVLAHDLGQHGLAIASGLARGIDTAAHHGSLATGTIAAVAGGVDVVYPQENQQLYDQLKSVGCILSDMPLGVEPQAKLFPRRNRIISGLSLGVVVVEAAMKSGSLITARMALEQGREVFAVPGSPLDPRCTGTNDLIRQGAVLTETANDIVQHIHRMPYDLLRGMAEPASEDFQSSLMGIDERELDIARDKVMECLSPTPVQVNDIIRACQLSPTIVFTILLELELGGKLERQAGGRVSLLS